MGQRGNYKYRQWAELLTNQYNQIGYIFHGSSDLVNGLTKTMHVPRNPQYNMHICDMGGKGGVGWGNNVHVNVKWHTHGMLCISVIWGGRVGEGWGNNVHVKWHTHGMLCISVIWGGRVGWGGAIAFMST